MKKKAIVDKSTETQELNTLTVIFTCVKIIANHIFYNNLQYFIFVSYLYRSEKL